MTLILNAVARASIPRIRITFSFPADPLVLFCASTRQQRDLLSPDKLCGVCNFGLCNTRKSLEHFSSRVEMSRGLIEWVQCHWVLDFPERRVEDPKLPSYANRPAPLRSLCAFRSSVQMKCVECRTGKGCVDSEPHRRKWERPGRRRGVSCDGIHLEPSILSQVRHS
jgi:hypothetical protein